MSCPGAGQNSYFYRCCSSNGHCGPKNNVSRSRALSCIFASTTTPHACPHHDLTSALSVPSLQTPSTTFSQNSHFSPIPLHPKLTWAPTRSSKTKTSTAAPAAKPATANATTRPNPLSPPPLPRPPTPATPVDRSSTPSARPGCAALAAISVGPGRISAARRIGVSRSGGSAREEGSCWMGWRCGEMCIKLKERGSQTVG